MNAPIGTPPWLDAVEVGFAADLAYERHDDINESLDHQADGSGQHEGDGELDHVALHDEFLEPTHDPLILPRWM
jgi:hypothetical protein